jgi:hypothetical protein
MSSNLERAYQAAVRSQKAKRRPAKKAPAKRRKKAAATREKRTPYSREVDEAVAILLARPIRHGSGSPGITELAPLAVRRKRKPAKRKPAKRKPAKKTATKRRKATAKKAPKTSRSRRPGESFKAHMARLRKLDGR